MAIERVHADKLQSWISDEKLSCKLVDVRGKGEFERCHIPGSVNIEASDLSSRADELQGADKVVLYCQGGLRAAKACAKLKKAGTTDVLMLEGGVSAWEKAGLPVEKNLSAPIEIHRQVQIVAGSLVAIGTLLGVGLNPWFLAVPAFVGLGLVFAGVTNTCGMAVLLSKLPYNN